MLYCIYTSVNKETSFMRCYSEIMLHNITEPFGFCSVPYAVNHQSLHNKNPDPKHRRWCQCRETLHHKFNSSWWFIRTRQTTLLPVFLAPPEFMITFALFPTPIGFMLFCGKWLRPRVMRKTNHRCLKLSYLFVVSAIAPTCISIKQMSMDKWAG